MKTIRRILVPVGDFRVRTLPVIDKAAQIASALDAELELFHDISVAVPVEALGAPGFSLKTLKSLSRRAALNGLERLAEPLRACGLKVSTTAVCDYPPYEAIVRRAISSGANLIIAPRRHEHRLRVLLGYTDWELLRLSPVPVLLVKSFVRYRRPVVLAAIDPTHAFAKPSALDQEILDMGMTFSRALHGSLHVVHGYLPLPLSLKSGVSSGNRPARRVLRAANREARQLFDKALVKTKIAVSNRHLIQANPVDAISRAARNARSAVVVMGAISRSGLKRLFIGNTAETVMDQIACDLLIVKPKHFSLRVPRARRGIQYLSAALYS